MTTATPTRLPQHRGAVGRSSQWSTARGRRRAHRMHRRLSFGLVVALLMAAAGAAAAVVVSRAPTSRAPTARAPGPTPLISGGPVAVLAQRDAAGAISSATVLAVAPGGRGGRVIFVPPGTMTELPSFGLDTVGRSYELGGQALLDTALSNLLGVNLGPATVMDDRQLSALVAPTGPVAVRVPLAVELVDAGGRVQTLWAAGDASLAPDDVGRFLSTKGQGNDLARFARHQAFWTAWLAAVARRSPSSEPAPGGGGLARTINAVAQGNVQYETLPVEAVDGGAGRPELYRARQADVDALVSEVLPALAAARLVRARVQILNGTGVVEQSGEVARRLTGIGARIVLTGNASSFGHEQTKIVYYDPGQQQAAERVAQALGVGTIFFDRQRLDVADVTVVVGKDFKR